MKKNTYHLISLLCMLAVTLGFTACNEDSYNGIENSGEVTITSFTAPGAKLTTLNEEKGNIQLVFPSSTDLTKLTPVIGLSEGADILLPENPEAPIDLSKTTVYRIVNGNLYHDYQVLALHVSDVAQITSFAIGKYKGTIDHAARTINVLYPIGSDVSALAPGFTMNEGAKLIQPLGSTIDFTEPVDYTISYLDETFTYKVSVTLVSLTPKAFLGEATTANEISNMDEKKAWEWFSDNFDGAEYISFKDLKEGKDLSKFGAIWYHYDSFGKGGDPTAPDAANNPAVVKALNDFLAQGGGLFLSSGGMALGKLLNISKDGNMFNNAWGFDAEPFEVNDGNGIGWGIRFINHPIFEGVRKPAGETNRCFLISNGCTTRGHNVRWNLKADWTPQYMGVDKLLENNGGKQLATLHWDDNMVETSVFTEYEAQAGKGAVITCGAEGYDWYEDNYPKNTYRDNIETITRNILNYISK